MTAALLVLCAVCVLAAVLLSVACACLWRALATLSARVAHMEGYLTALKAAPSSLPSYTPPPTPAQLQAQADETAARAERFRAEDEQAIALLRREFDIPVDMPIAAD